MAAAALLMLAAAAPAFAQTVSIVVPSNATFLRPDRIDVAANATAVPLAPLGLAPGMVVDVRSTGDWNNGPNGDIFPQLGVVFSSSSTLLDRAQRYRVPGAIGVGRRYVTLITCPSSDSLDIPEDFDVDADSTIVTIPPGAAYLFVTTADCYWVDNTDPDGDLRLKISVLGLADVPSGHMSARFAAGPNPFGRATTLHFTLARDADVRLAVYDVTGRLQRKLASGRFVAGEHTAAWDCRDDAGRTLPRGSYFVRIADGSGTRTLKVTHVD